jgi:hypothetical protein
MDDRLAIKDDEKAASLGGLFHDRPSPSSSGQSRRPAPTSAKNCEPAAGMFVAAGCTIHGLSHGLCPNHPGERHMSKFAIRLLTLVIYAAPLVLVPMVAPAKAATSSKEIKKKKKKPQANPGIGDPRSSTQDSPIQSFDGKPIGGGY